MAAQVQTMHARMLVDSRMRDIRRRVEVIQKKLADLQEMGVPCAFCYSSVRNTGSIFTLGDKRITDVIERYRNEILCNLMDDNHVSNTEIGSSLQEIHLILPVLPAPLEELNRITLQSMIVGILKDLGIRWSDPKPVWWPADIPFVPPRSVPDNFTGNWLSALKAILRSVYGYFSYDINSYIASKLETRSSNSRLHKLASSQSHRALIVSDADEDTYSEPEPDPDEETCSDDDDDDDDDGGKPEEVFRQQVGAGQKPLRSSVTNSVALPKMSSTNYGVVTSSPKPVSSNRHISSFTVENILMNKQQSSSSGSVSSSHSPTSSNSAPSLPSPTTGSSSISSSIVGVNWVSHPPVKYTKFTILSPVAMSDEAQKRRKSGDLSNLGSKTEEIRASPMAHLENDTHLHNIKQPPASHHVPYARHASSEYKPPPPATTTAMRVFSLPPATTSPTFKDSPPTSVPCSSSPRLCTLPVVTTLQASSNDMDKKVVLSKSFPPSHQYVLLVPSSSAAVVPDNTQSASNSTLGMPQRKTEVPSATSTGSPLMRSGIKTVSFQSPPLSSATSSGSKMDMSGGRLERATLNNRNLAESNSFRLIAPKQKNALADSPESDNDHSSSGSERSRLHSRGAIHKPPKLRFHMTTVVTKQKRVPVKSSMTVESPLAMVDNSREHGAVVAANCSPGSDLPMESIIMRSPNVFSRDQSKPVGGERTPSKPARTEHNPGVPSGTVRSPSIASKPTRIEYTPSKVTRNDYVESQSRVKTESMTTPPQRMVMRKLGVQNGDYPLPGNRVSDANDRQRQTLDKSPPTDQQSRDSITTRHRGRTTRSYTRRKRELTFHLYEDPGTAFRAKRACKE